MNLRARFVVSIGLLSLLCLILPGSLRADTVYTYTGNAYNSADCIGTYCSGGPYAMSITFDTTLSGSAVDDLTMTNSPNGNLGFDISRFSLTDGMVSISSADPGAFLDVDITTDGTGNIVSWNLFAGFDNQFLNSINAPSEPNVIPLI